MRYKGGAPPLMIYAAFRASMICQACGLDKKSTSRNLSIFCPTRKDSEPCPRKARAGSTPKKSVAHFLLGASTQALVLTNRPTEKPRRAGPFYWPTRKDSEPRPRKARAGSTPKNPSPISCLVLPLRLSSSRIGQQKSPGERGLSVGLPERIRTFDLQSRSLTRYPAVPRVGIYGYLDIIPQIGEKCNPFLKKSRLGKHRFAVRFRQNASLRTGVDPCGKLPVSLWIFPQGSRKLLHSLWKTLWTSQPKFRNFHVK